MSKGDWGCLSLSEDVFGCLGISDDVWRCVSMCYDIWGSCRYHKVGRVGIDGR